MTRTKLLPCLGISMAAMLSAAPASGTSMGCPGLNNAVCVSQVGDRNVAETRMEGQANGAGIVPAESATGLTVVGSGAPAADLTMPALPSGVISQQGDDNQATVEIEGDFNAFHVSQQGSRHIASQTVVGSGNSVGVEQGRGTFDSDNISNQVQIGSNNVLRSRQFGSANIAVQAQVPSAEAALLAFAGVNGLDSSQLLGRLAGGADNNRILLEQNGDGNEAYLGQVGYDNQIALRQQGGAEITIIQFGVGHSIGIEQPAGQRGVQILQY